MKRIGVAASRIAKDNYWLYHLYVVLISSLVSLFLFLVVGVVVVFALSILSYISHEVMDFEFSQHRRSVFMICMVSLTIVTLLFNVLAILQNLRLPHDEK